MATSNLLAPKRRSTADLQPGDLSPTPASGPQRATADYQPGVDGLAGNRESMLASAPLRPSQASAIGSNAQNAYDSARNALAAPLPPVGAAGQSNGTASFTDENGRTITRTYGHEAGSGTYTQRETGPGLEPRVTKGAAFPGYTQAEVDQIAPRRQAFADSQNARGDALTEKLGGAPNRSQAREAGQLANATAAENLNEQKLFAPLSVEERKANIRGIDAKSAATEAGVDQYAKLHQELNDVQTARKMDADLHIKHQAEQEAAHKAEAQRLEGENKDLRTKHQQAMEQIVKLQQQIAAASERQREFNIRNSADPFHLSSPVASPAPATSSSTPQPPIAQQPAAAPAAPQPSIGAPPARYQEGDRLQHPETGEIIELRGGRWVAAGPPQNPSPPTRNAGGTDTVLRQ